MLRMQDIGVPHSAVPAVMNRYYTIKTESSKTLDGTLWAYGFKPLKKRGPRYAFARHLLRRFVKEKRDIRETGLQRRVAKCGVASIARRGVPRDPDCANV